MMARMEDHSADGSRQSMGEGPSPITIDDIRSARVRLGTEVVETPLLYARELSALMNVDVYLKCENLQRTGSFKIRGAMNKILTLASQPGTRGIITASSGNHGQAVAAAAQAAQFPCTVVVPETVLTVKERAIRGFGAEVVKCGLTSAERIERAVTLAAERGWTFVPPYDDRDVMAGQGTVGLEICAQLQPAAVFVPVGGGGLLAGVATAVKSLSPSTRVYGAEPALADDTFRSLQAGHIVGIGPSETMADGLRSSHPGQLTFPIVQHYVDDIVQVDEVDLETAFVRLLTQAKVLVEPSGCASVAAATRLLAGTAVMARTATSVKLDGPIVCVLSGGNIDPALVVRLLG